MDGDLVNAQGTFLFVNCHLFRRGELNGWACSCQIPKKGVILLLGSITLIPPTVFMKPSSYLKVTVNMSLIITIGYDQQYTLCGTA